MNDLAIEFDQVDLLTPETHPQTDYEFPKIWRRFCGDAPFTPITVLALANIDRDVFNSLIPIAPDRFGFGTVSQNMLTRWLKSNEGKTTPFNDTHNLVLKTIGIGIWQFALVPISDESF